MPSDFRYQRRVEFADTDCAGILHFASFFRFMEEAEHAFLRSLGLSVHRPQADGGHIGFPRLSARCEYARALAFEDVVDVDLWISRLGRKTIEFSFEMLCRGETAARGQLLTIACRVAKDGRVESIPLPEAFRAALAVSTRPAVVFRGPPEGGSR